jgi:polyhydroxyalkanoate synthesis regulator phasin
MLERLIASFRTAEERNTAERARIQALEAKVAGLEQRVTALEAP